MRQFNNPRSSLKSTKKRFTRKRLLFVLIFAFLAIWAGYSYLNPESNSYTIKTTLTTSPTNSRALNPTDFYTSVNASFLVDKSTGIVGIVLQMDVMNDLHMRVHYMNVTVVFDNYTLSDNTVVTNPTPRQIVIVSGNYSTDFPFQIVFPIGSLSSNLRVTEAVFTFTVYVQELSSPLVWTQHMLPRQ